MGRDERWDELKTGLPQPLEIRHRPAKAGGWARHFHVRAMRYREEYGRRIVGLDPEFTRFFDVPALRPGLDVANTDGPD